MPSTNKTAHELNLWVESDVPVMDDFNDDDIILEEFMEYNGVRNMPFVLPKNDWRGSDLLACPYEALISEPEATNSHDTHLLFDMRSVLTARKAGITDGIGQTVPGGVKIYALQKPESELTGVCTTTYREDTSWEM